MSERLATYSGGLSPVRGRGAPCTPGLKLPPSGGRTQEQLPKLGRRDAYPSVHRGKIRRRRQERASAGPTA
jgi:hypothetical protein